MIVKMLVKMIEGKTLIVHFIEERPNIKGVDRFKLFVEKLQKALGIDLKGIKIVLSPVPPKEGTTVELNWTRFDECFVRLKDFIAEK